MVLYPLHFIAATSSFVHKFQSKQSTNGVQWFSCILPIVVGCINALLFVDSLAVPLNWGKIIVSLPVYVHAAAVVVMAYVTLVLINVRYIYLAIIPVIMLVFISALCNEISLKSKLNRISSSVEAREVGGSGSKKADENCDDATKQDVNSSNEDEHNHGNDKKAEVMVTIAVMPYWVLCLMGQFCGADNFVTSYFLLFLSSSLGALTLMIARLASEIAPRLAPVLDLLHKSTLVVLLLTAHTIATEFLGQDMVVAFMPELLAVILWLGIHLDNGGSSTMSIQKKVTSSQEKEKKIDITSYANGVVAILIVVTAAALAYLAGMDGLELEGRKMWSSWVGRVFPAGCISGLLPYFTALMISHWPGLSPDSSKGAVQLLWFWANVSLAATTMMLICACTLLAATYISSRR